MLPRGYRPEPRLVFRCLRVKHDAPDDAAIGIKHLVVVGWVTGKTCPLEVKHWPSKLGDSDGRGSQSEPNHGDPYNRREYGNYYEDTLPRRHGEPSWPLWPRGLSYKVPFVAGNAHFGKKRLLLTLEHESYCAESLKLSIAPLLTGKETHPCRWTRPTGNQTPAGGVFAVC
jgi:hypothetical protein